jgi:hypothetical protein
MKLSTTAVALAVSVALSFVFAAAPALALTDDIYMAAPNGTNPCVNIQLPDDSGWSGKGEYAYVIAMSPGPALTWSDMTQQLTRKISENNTARIPICFSRKGNSSCGERFVLTINSSVSSRTIRGGVCESGVAGYSTSPSGQNQSVGSSLNSNYGIFDVAFADSSYRAAAGAVLNVSALAGSYRGGTTVHLALSGLQGVTPASGHDVVFTSVGGNNVVQFQGQAPASSGTYELTLQGSIPGCTATGCSITRKVKLYVGDAAPVSGGFRMGLFPTAISASPGQAVSVMLTIYNYEVGRQFSVTATMPYGVDTDLAAGRNVSVAADGSASVNFTLTPRNVTGSFEFLVQIDSEGTKKIASGYINIDGELAGIERGMGFVQSGNPSAMGQAADALDAYRSNPSDQNYGRLQDELDRLARQARNYTAPSDNNTGPVTTPANQSGPQITVPQQGRALDLLGKDMWIVFAIVGVLFVVSIVFYMRKGKTGKKKQPAGRQEFNYEERSPF